MNQFFLALGVLIGVVLLLPFYRVMQGPTLFDRLLGASAVGSKTITMVLLLGFLFNRVDMFVDISMGYAILNFVGVLAMAKYFRRSPEDQL
jgi:multicomponent Na+:H+ antiporter subunit F